MKREVIVEGEAICGLIPQRPPMVMIDRFFGIEGTTSFSGLTVRTDNLFCHEGVFQETGIIEHIAQSAAARIGYIYTQKQEAVPLGFIGSVEKMKIYRLPEAGTELLTEITIVQEVFDITLIAAEVKAGDTGKAKTGSDVKTGGGERIAECRMKIYLKKE